MCLLTDDHSQVVLEEIKIDEISGNINASYIPVSNIKCIWRQYNDVDKTTRSAYDDNTTTSIGRHNTTQQHKSTQQRDNTKQYNGVDTTFSLK